MYAALSFIVVLFYASLTVATPYRLAERFDAVLNRLRRLVLTRSSLSDFDLGGSRGRKMVRSVQLAGALSAIIFVVLCVYEGLVIENHPDTLSRVLGLALTATGAATILVMLCSARSWLLSDARACLTLSECGIRSLWLVGNGQRNDSLREHLKERVLQSTRVEIVDLNGHQFLGKGPGADGGLFYDVLAETPNVPVSLLLLKPEKESETRAARHQASFRAVLTDLGIDRATYLDRMYRTLKWVETLNESRTPENRIQVGFFTERPSMRGVLLDEEILVSPWSTRREKGPIPLLEMSRRSAVPSFFDTFRLQHARLAAIGRREAYVPVARTVDGAVPALV